MAFQDAYNDYVKNGSGQAVSGMYDSQKQAKLGALKNTYQQNLSDAQASRENIGKQYQTAANDLSTQYERNRRNLNIQAAANGINTGTGSQQRLALQNIYNRDFGNLRGQEAADVAEANRGIDKLTQTYRNEVNTTSANSDAAKMAALLQGYQDDIKQRRADAATLAGYGDFSGYNGLYTPEQIAAMSNKYSTDQQLQRAQTLASFGDFSGYEGAGYTPEQVSRMSKLWNAQNPLLAYNTGRITAAEYKAMTGQDAPGAASSAGGGYSGYRGGPAAGNNGDTQSSEETGTPAGVTLSPEEAVLQMREAGATSAEIRKALEDDYTADGVAAGNRVLASITRNEREA